jgi:hypothetical protein
MSDSDPMALMTHYKRHESDDVMLNVVQCKTSDHVLIIHVVFMDQKGVFVYILWM